MCGIFALFLKRPLTDADIAIGRAGTAQLAHRGPDSSGEWFDTAAGVYLGHRRLAILDPQARSDQPMVHRGTVLSYNGEIYNFRTLAAQLAQQGVALETSGDVEVVLRAWCEWGETVLDRIDGMFAFALWDGRSAHLAVDAFGEKPLFVAETDDGVYVSSELGPLSRLLNLTPQIDDAGWCGYLAYGNFHAPATPFREVRRLEPAQVVSVSDGILGSPRTYWRPPRGEPGRGRVEAVPESGLTRIAEALTNALRGRLISDVPLALFLSGGIDSALVASLARQELATELTCLTVSYPRGDAVDESGRAAKIAQHLDHPHVVLESDEDPSQAGVERLLDIMQQPHDNLSALSVSHLSKMAADRFKVCITGMGGDELTFGYGKHDQLYRARYLQTLPAWLRGAVRAACGPLARYSDRFDLARNVFLLPHHEVYLALKNYPAIGGLRRLDGFDRMARTDFAGDLPPYLAVPPYELVHALPNDQLMVYDHASMSASLELRTPFLSRELAELMAEFDPRALLAFGQKSVLRRLLLRYLPKPLFDYPKSGFRFPHDLFLEGLGEQLPPLPGLAPSLAQDFWNRRHEGRGWTRLGVRLSSASEFLRRHQPAARADAA